MNYVKSGFLQNCDISHQVIDEEGGKDSNSGTSKQKMLPGVENRRFGIPITPDRVLREIHRILPP